MRQCGTDDIIQKFDETRLRKGLGAGGRGCEATHIPYSRKIWWGIKFGGLAVYITIAKLKSAKISYSHIILYVWRSRTEPQNLNPSNILAIAILDLTAKFNSRQYFQLYGTL